MAVAMGLAGCTGRPPLPESGSAEARLYKEKCGRCHKPHKPRLYGPGRWAYVVDHMADKQMIRLEPAEHDAILEYLRRHARF